MVNIYIPRSNLRSCGPTHDTDGRARWPPAVSNSELERAVMYGVAGVSIHNRPFQLTICERASYAFLFRLLLLWATLGLTLTTLDANLLEVCVGAAHSLLLDHLLEAVPWPWDSPSFPHFHIPYIYHMVHPNTSVLRAPWIYTSSNKWPLPCTGKGSPFYHTGELGTSRCQVGVRSTTHYCWKL